MSEKCLKFDSKEGLRPFI